MVFVLVMALMLGRHSWLVQRDPLPPSCHSVIHLLLVPLENYAKY